MLDCDPILLPGPGAVWTRLVFWHRAEPFLPLAPYAKALANKRGDDVLELARERVHIPRYMHGGHEYVSASWLIGTFPEAERQIAAVCELATRMRDERAKSIGKTGVRVEI